MIKSSNIYEQNNNSVIVQRFYLAVSTLLKRGDIKSIKSFTEKYHINRGNFITTSKNPTSKMFNVGWLSYIAKDYGVSSEWLLTGNGEMLQDANIEKKLKEK